MSRPIPPADLLESPWLILRPAPEVWEWIQREILDTTGSIHNEEHAHLIDASVGVMWASSSFAKKGRSVLGQAEQLMIRAGGWQKARQEQQLRDWFGEEPEFLITLAADYCAQCSEAEFCALVEHELYHIAQATDQYGAPKFTREGLPKLHTRFNVPRTELIPAGQFDTACNFIAAYALEGEYIEALPKDGVTLDQYETHHLYLLMSRFAAMFKHKNDMLAASRALGSTPLMGIFEQLKDGDRSFEVLDRRRGEIYGAYSATGCQGGYAWRAAA